MYTKVKN